VKISEHFSRSEFACKCGCDFSAVDVELLGVLESLREHYGAPITITSGCRCEAHNAAVGGAPKSYHVRGLAADISVSGESPAVVAEFLDGLYPDNYGIGTYSGWVHLDVRPGTYARWED
jgi:uncharacterized protein YcbK (DUF882 family)